MGGSGKNQKRFVEIRGGRKKNELLRKIILYFATDFLGWKDFRNAN